MGTFGIALGAIGLIGGIFGLLLCQLFAELFHMKTSTIVIISVIIMVLGMIFGVTAEPSAPSSSYSSSRDYNSSNHECYVCGKKATHKYGSYYYCTTHKAMAQTIYENQ